MASKYHGHGKTYLKVWMVLLIFTAITVWVSYHNFGTYNILVAMLVASIKGALVCLFFMHLKYDHRANQVIFLSAFFFLAIFISLTASDELFRRTERAAVAAQEEAPSGAAMKEFLQPTPELVAKGKELFSLQCAVCHGAQGKGDGPGAAALNPKPRDFTSGYWRYGGGVARVFKTIGEGSPGTAMASFSNLSVKERFALAHYVRSLGPKLEEEKPEDLAAFGVEQGPGTRDQGPTAPTQRIPVSFAMKQIAEEQLPLADVNAAPQDKGPGLGEKLYQAHCLSCHGLNGKGGIPVKKISVNPSVFLKTRELAGAKAGWASNRQEFIDLVSKGLPGQGKPGIAGFTDEEWQALYQYVLSLRP